MNLSVKCVGIVASFFAFSAYAQCDNPAIVEVPDGATSTLEQMLEAQTAVRNFMAAMEEYLDCLNEEIEALTEESPEETRVLLVERHNSGITEMEALAAAFNEQRIAYQEANPSN
jgi:hypothetical protein